MGLVSGAVVIEHEAAMEFLAVAVQRQCPLAGLYGLGIVAFLSQAFGQTRKDGALAFLDLPTRPHRPLFVGFLRKELILYQAEGEPVLVQGFIEISGFPGRLGCTAALLELPGVYPTVRPAIERVSRLFLEHVARVGTTAEARLQCPAQETDRYPKALLRSLR